MQSAPPKPQKFHTPELPKDDKLETHPMLDAKEK
jgi:hypothetical protein